MKYLFCLALICLGCSSSKPQDKYFATIEIGNPVKIPELDGESCFFRVPIYCNGKPVSYFDTKEKVQFRRRTLGRSIDLNDIPLNTLGMSKDQVLEKAKHISPDDTKVIGEPKLVYDGDESKVGWAVEMEDRIIIVTPNYAYTK